MKTVIVSILIGATLAMGETNNYSQIADKYSAILKMARAAKARPDQQLTQSEVDFIVESSKDNLESTQCATAYALAFTDSPSGTNALRTLASNKHPWVAGVAEFSEVKKRLSHLTDKELLDYASTNLSDLINPIVKTMMASWLGDRLRGDAVPLFLASLGKEEDCLVRTELLFQVATLGNLSQLDEANSMVNQALMAKGIKYTGDDTIFLNYTSENKWARKAPPGYVVQIIKYRRNAEGPK